MALARVALFNRQELPSLFIIIFIIAAYSWLIEYQNYIHLKRFDDARINAVVVKQYAKHNSRGSYQLLKLKSDQGFSFYTSVNKNFEDVVDREVTLTMATDRLTFTDFMSSFYAKSYAISINPNKSYKHALNRHLDGLHDSPDASAIYKALITATPLPNTLAQSFSNLGISHLLAISGFHLGVLSALLYFLLRPPYRFFHSRFFPYRHANRDLFMAVIITLLFYMLFLDSPPSLMRAFAMLLVGFILFDRGFEVVSMQTLSVSVILLLALFPRLFFALGFWLSVAGVFYIFLFMICFKARSRLFQFALLPIWVYAMMLPFSLFIFGSFSLYHPLSILWTLLFSIFYPLSLALHVVGFGASFDDLLLWLISLGDEGVKIVLPLWVFAAHLLLSITAIKAKYALYVLSLLSLFIVIYAVYHVA